MKPTELKLTDDDRRVIEKIYMDLWKEKGETGGAILWAEVILRFVEIKRYILKPAPESGE